MPTRRYSLNRGEPKRLEITSSASFKNTTVRLDGNPIGSVPTMQELKSGKSFPLGDGSEVKVQLRTILHGRWIEVERDGRPLPESPSDPFIKLRAASKAVFIAGGVNLLLGLLIVWLYTPSQSQALDAFFQSQSPLQTQEIGLGLLIAGVLYPVLGFYVRRKSKIALGIAVAFFALILVLNLVVSVIAASSPVSVVAPSVSEVATFWLIASIGGLYTGIFLLIVMSRGFRAIDSIRVEEETIQ